MANFFGKPYVNYLVIAFFSLLVIASTGCVALQNLQDKTASVATENIEDITTGLNIKSIEGVVRTDGRISILYLRVTTQAGSSSVNLSEVIIHMSDGKAFFDLFYSPDSNVMNSYTAKPIIDKGLQFTASKPFVEKGDFMAINIDTIQNGIDLRSYDVLTMSFESAKGNKAYPMVIELGTLMAGANRIY